MNILFTCAGRRTYLLKYFKENLSEGDKVAATDMQLSSPALQVADVKIQVPAVYDPKYIDVTLDICKEQKIDALISLNDLELPILAENKKRFEESSILFFNKTRSRLVGYKSGGLYRRRCRVIYSDIAFV